MTLPTGKLRDWLLLLACNLMWASQFVMVKLVQEQMGPLFAVTFPIALSTLLLIFLIRREPAAAITKQDVINFILLGIMGQLFAQLFITWGVRFAPASNAALISLIMPVSTAVMAHLFLREHMSRIRWISFGLAILGVAVCSGVDWNGLNFGRTYLVGNILIFISVLGSAFYNAYSKKVLERHSPLRVLLYSYYVLLAVLLPLTIGVEPEGLRNFAPLFGHCLGRSGYPCGLPIFPVHGDLPQRPYPARRYAGGALQLSDSFFWCSDRSRRSSRALDWIHDRRRPTGAGQHTPHYRVG